MALYGWQDGAAAGIRVCADRRKAGTVPVGGHCFLQGKQVRGRRFPAGAETEAAETAGAAWKAAATEDGPCCRDMDARRFRMPVGFAPVRRASVWARRKGAPTSACGGRCRPIDIRLCARDSSDFAYSLLRWDQNCLLRCGS